MKYYKIICKDRNGHTFNAYEETKEKALQYVEKRVNVWQLETKMQKRPVDLFLHHQATAPGYIGKKFGWAEWYNGIYGVGIRYHHPNTEKKTSSHAYHIVSYLIEK